MTEKTDLPYPNNFVIDYKLVEEKAARLCTQKDIAYAVGTIPETFSLRKQSDVELVAALERGWAKARGEIVNKQYEVGVVEGNVQMLMHLGKTYCNQTDKLILAGDKDNPLIRNDPEIDALMKYFYGNRKSDEVEASEENGSGQPLHQTSSDDQTS